jgi:hypothetical protein
LARLHPSPSNKENFKLAVDAATGFLSTVSADPEVQLLAIAEEAAKSFARLALQNARVSFLRAKVIVLQDSFDPLSPPDVARINDAIRAAIVRAAGAYPAVDSSSRFSTAPLVVLSIHHVDGSSDMPTGLPQLQACLIGVCARAMTARIVRVSIDGVSVAGKLVAIPTSEVIPVPVPQTILADQKISITMQGGILQAYNFERDSGLLTLVKLPGAVVGGLVAGITEQFTAKKTVVDAQKGLAESETALAKAKKERLATLELENATPGVPFGIYQAQTLTFYLHSETLASAIQQQIDKPKQPQPGEKKTDGDLLAPRESGEKKTGADPVAPREPGEKKTGADPVAPREPGEKKVDGDLLGPRSQP